MIREKFKTEEELFLAYKALEAEFTKRCQRLTALEKELKELREGKNVEEEKNNLIAELLNDETVKNAIIAQYLKELALKKDLNRLSSSTGYTAITPPKRPKNLQEAKELAQIMLKNN